MLCMTCRADRGRAGSESARTRARSRQNLRDMRYNRHEKLALSATRARAPDVERGRRDDPIVVSLELQQIGTSTVAVCWCRTQGARGAHAHPGASIRVGHGS